MTAHAPHSTTAPGRPRQYHDFSRGQQWREVFLRLNYFVRVTSYESNLLRRCSQTAAAFPLLMLFGDSACGTLVLTSCHPGSFRWHYSGVVADSHIKEKRTCQQRWETYAAQHEATAERRRRCHRIPGAKTRPYAAVPCRLAVAIELLTSSRKAGFRHMYEIMHREIIVSGDDALSKTIAEELRGAGARIIQINTAADLLGAGVHRARAVVCAGPNDAVNLEIALLARQYSPNVRVVARLANDVLREAVAAVNGPGAILDVADLAAPSVVEAVLSRNAHQFDTAGIEFVVWGAEAPYDGTLREIYADLAPVAVVHGKNSPAPGEVVPCPGRDLQVYAGDWTSMIGVKDEMEARGITVPPRDRDALSPLPGTTRDRCRARHARRREPDAFSLVGVRGGADARRDSRGALHLPEPADVVDRRPVLRLRDDYDRGLRRFQLRPTIHLPATVRCRVDVRRRDRHRHPRRVPCGPAAVAPLRPNGWTPTGTPDARPRRRCRTGFSRHPRRE